MRSFEELSDEFRVEIATDATTDLDVPTVVVELGKNIEQTPSLKSTLLERLRDELLIRPAMRFEPYGTLERTMFKAKRIVDLCA